MDPGANQPYMLAGTTGSNKTDFYHAIAGAQEIRITICINNVSMMA